MTRPVTKWHAKRAPSKYHSKRVSCDGVSFQSMLERDYFVQLKLLKKAGEVKFFLRQVPFDLGGGVTYRLDFLVFYSNGLVDFVDVKGFETDTFKIKKKLLESQYDIALSIVTKKDM